MCRDFKQRLVKSLIDSYSFSDQFVVHDLARHTAGHATVTCDPRTGHFIGLHIDSWDRGKLSERINSRNRLCVNLGLSERYLIFLNLPLARLVRILITKPQLSSEPYILGPNN